MLEIEVHLAQETKALEWNKAHPTFRELKERLRQCGIAAGKNFCVEVERGREFVTLDDDDLLDGPLIRVRASQIRCTTPYNEETDVFLASPLPPFDFSFPKFLHPASGIAVGDTVHCLGFPKLGTGTRTLTLSEQEFPAVFSGNVCFSGWKQALADYRSFPNCSGAVVVDDCGRLKGIHVSALSAAEFIPDIRSEDEGGRNVRERTKELVERMNNCLPQLRNGVKRTAEAAVFVPINVLMKSLAISPTKAVLHL